MSLSKAFVPMKSRNLEVKVVLVRLGIIRHLEPTGVSSTLIAIVITNRRLTLLNRYLNTGKHTMSMIML